VAGRTVKKVLGCRRREGRRNPRPPHTMRTTRRALAEELVTVVPASGGVPVGAVRRGGQPLLKAAGQGAETVLRGHVTLGDLIDNLGHDPRSTYVEE
jgi:hypothetical protein